MQQDEDKIIEIFSGTLWEAEMVKSLLEAAQIRSFLKNHSINSYAYESGFAEGVKVMIMNNDLDEARTIVEDFLRK